MRPIRGNWKIPQEETRLARSVDGEVCHEQGLEHRSYWAHEVTEDVSVHSVAES